MKPEERARVLIDDLLLAAGWYICDMAQANIHAAPGVALREFPLNPGHGVADYLLYVSSKACGVIEAKKAGVPLKVLPPLADQIRIVAEVDRHLSNLREVNAEIDANLKRAQALRQAALKNAFSGNRR
jgi:hypothetical protein